VAEQVSKAVAKYYGNKMWSATGRTEVVTEIRKEVVRTAGAHGSFVDDKWNMFRATKVEPSDAELANIVAGVKTGITERAANEWGAPATEFEVTVKVTPKVDWWVHNFDRNRRIPPRPGEMFAVLQLRLYLSFEVQVTNTQTKQGEHIPHNNEAAVEKTLACPSFRLVWPADRHGQDLYGPFWVKG
jgi:hypothetical protein